MNCPVCPNASIAVHEVTCANCGADLGPIQRLRELPARWYNEALELLRGGDHDGAVARLESAAALEGASPHILRLLGKALWNSGRHRDAAVQWRRLPDDDEARRLLSMAGRTGESAHSFRLAASWTAIVVLVVALIIAILWRPTRTSSVPLVQPAALVEPSIPSPAEPAARPLASLEARLREQDGLRVERTGNTLKVVFRRGLYASGSDQPAIEGEMRLRNLARLLGDDRLDVIVVGFTDSPAPPRTRWPDNWSLGFSRAQSAVEVMRGAAGEQVTWAATSSGDRSPPHPPQDDAQNRTVVLHVSAPEERSAQ